MTTERANELLNEFAQAVRTEESAATFVALGRATGASASVMAVPLSSVENARLGQKKVREELLEALCKCG